MISQYYKRANIVYKKRIIIGEMFLPVDFLVFLTSGTGRTFHQYPRKITAKPLVFPPVRVSSSKRRKKIRVGQTVRQSNWRGINDATWDDGGCEKRGRNGFSRGKIEGDDARASSHRALRFSRSLRTFARSRGRKGLIEFLLINYLRGATIIATHELSHYRNCGSN